jgi:hypothetical protein
MQRPSRWIAITLLMLVSLDVHAAGSASISPFSVSYEVIFRGLNAGTASLTLQRDNGDRWRYESRNEARGLFRLAFPGEITQTSVFRIDDDVVIRAKPPALPSDSMSIYPSNRAYKIRCRCRSR